jgi:hypothetical protein
VASIRVVEKKEQVAPNIEQLRGSQPSSLGGKEQPSKSVRQKSWYGMAMQDAQDQEASRSMIRGSESSETGHTVMEGIASMSEGVSNEVDWRGGMIADLIAKIEPTPGGRNTFLAKREC